MTELLFQLQKVSHGFAGAGLALDNISFTIGSGGCIALMGCNGAGKSTLLHILAGIVTPGKGEILWNGCKISPEIISASADLRSEFRRRVGIVFQDPDSQWLCDTVLDEVLYGPLQLWPADEARDRITSVMQILGIDHLSNQPPYVLSGGEKRRVALASIISMDPEVLLLDEPTSNLDAATVDFLMEWLNEFIQRPGKTLIIATHDLSLIRELAGRCVVLTPCHKLARVDDVETVLNDVELLRQMNLISRRRRCLASEDGVAGKQNS